MLFGVYNLIAVVALTAFVVNADPGPPPPTPQPGFQQPGSPPEPVHHGDRIHHKRHWKHQEMISGFQSCQSRVSNYGPQFETACKDNKPQVLTSGLVDIRTSIVTLSAQVHADVGTWAPADVHSCATSYVNLLAKLQVLLEIIHSHNKISSCQDSVVGLNPPLKALSSAFIGAGVNVKGLLGAQVNISLLSSIGISIGVSA